MMQISREAFEKLQGDVKVLSDKVLKLESQGATDKKGLVDDMEKLEACVVAVAPAMETIGNKVEALEEKMAVGKAGGKASEGDKGSAV